MISSICFTPPPSSTRTKAAVVAASVWLGQRPLSSTHLRPPPPRYYKLTQRKISRGICRAEFSQDAPFAVAIGACILNSLVFPSISPRQDDDDDGDSVIDSTDSRFAVMGIISFIPYFNWLSWVFAWLDTGKQRYVVYALVYLAPYLRSNLSLSPEESWLPIASILFCIIHIQLEVSVQNGDLQAFQLFTDAAKHLSPSVSRKREDLRRDFEEGMEDNKNLPDAEEKSRNDIREWGVPKKSFQDSDYLDEDGEADRRKH